MNRELIRYILRFVLVVLVQVLVLNNLQFSGYINPYVYVWFILVLPFDTPGWLVLILAFFLGLGIDLFPQGISGPGSSLGIHAAATVFLAFMRPYVLNWIGSREERDSRYIPDAVHLGWLLFAGYVMIMAGMHHFMLFTIEEFSFRHLLRVLFRTLLSTFFTGILILIWEAIRPSGPK